MIVAKNVPTGLNKKKFHKKTALALGYFDGVHLGHRAVLGTAIKYAKVKGLSSAVFTFPQEDGLGLKGKALLSATQKHLALEELGVEYCFEPPFESFKKLSPQEFFSEMIVKEFAAKALFCGEDYRFGAKRAGDVGLLFELCKANNIQLFIVPMANFKDENVSSSRIRAALSEGEIQRANEMLGRTYEIDFPVEKGAGIGHVFGFPTINQIFPQNLQAVKQGVYITKTLINGQAYPSVTGFTSRPTVSNDESKLTCETFIQGFSGDLYGQKVCVQFYKRIADVTKFSSKEELAKAVKQWAKQAVGFFDENKKIYMQ